MKREYRLFVHDILEAIEHIEKFVEGMSFNEFYEDDKTKSAVVWKLEVIGEATKNISKEIKAKYRELPWKDMSRMRDKIAHFYFGIDYKIVWKVVKEELPEIKPKIIQILKDLEVNL